VNRGYPILQIKPLNLTNRYNSNMAAQPRDIRRYVTSDGKVPFILLLCGGNKRTQAKDIEIAQKYWQDYRRRENASQ
jgi:hypothetical protein